MTSAIVLLLESDKASAPSFAPALEKRGYNLTIVHSATDAAAEINGTVPGVIVVDAASLKTSGTRMCRDLRKALTYARILLVVDRKTLVDENNGADLTLQLPFTPRKLLNGVNRLMPAGEGASLQVGPIKLNLAQRKVKCGSREERLTPKQSKLLEVLMRHAGEVVTRKMLIKQVWDTDYTGDTRTLDVHVSWLRSVIEPNPVKPRYLKTLRGQGYRLDAGPE
ncbi:MAG TPA: response regulator transcription factor [Anaerolineales bacterium]|nr:response regulator transcription factor [Anaerolineales bacterium]HLF00703.1 response regulator transcription factor [Anaerolineales bacterium]